MDFVSLEQSLDTTTLRQYHFKRSNHGWLVSSFQAWHATTTARPQLVDLGKSTRSSVLSVCR